MSAATAIESSSARPTRLIVVFVAKEAQSEALLRAIEQLPATWTGVEVDVVVLLQVERKERPLPAALAALERGSTKTRILRETRRQNFGGSRKTAYAYALQHDFDYVAVLEPDARFAPQRLGELLAAARLGADMVIAARGGSRRGSWINRVLDLEVEDYASAFRLLACRALRRVPFQLDSDGRGFDTELLIQFRALGARIVSVECGLAADPSFSARESLKVALGYRAHQLHLTRRGQYFVDHDVRYTLKHHPSSSHALVLDAITSGASVLDLGCSQGLLAEPLARKGVRVVGVDVQPPENVSNTLTSYFQRDLEKPLDLPLQREFDYVICSDVIEHIVRRPQLLASARRYLKPTGRLLISTPNIAIWFYRLSLLLGRFEYGPRGVLDETHVHLFTRATFRREVEGASFRVLRERVTALPFEVVFESTGRNALVRSFASAYHALARAWPELFAYQFLIEAEVATDLHEHELHPKDVASRGTESR